MIEKIGTVCYVNRYKYGKQLIPRMGEFKSLWYALDLNSADCSVELEAPQTGKPQAAKVFRFITSGSIVSYWCGSKENKLRGVLLVPSIFFYFVFWWRAFNGGKGLARACSTSQPFAHATFFF